MVDTKSVSQSVKNWEDSISRVPARYKEGVQNAQNVIEKSRAAEDVWATAVTDAAARKARSRGLADVSDQDWKNAASKVGASRIGEGMREGRDKFNSGIGEVLSRLQGITLPPRTTDPRENVMNRVATIAEELHKMKTEE